MFFLSFVSQVIIIVTVFQTHCRINCLTVFPPAVEPDQFFRVDLFLNMTGNPLDPKDIIEKWVKH